MIRLPRLYTSGGAFVRPLNIVSASITLNIVPLSTATLTMPNGDALPMRTFVEMFTPYGSAGMFRVRSPRDAYGHQTSTVELEHMISEVGDYVVKDEISEMLAASTAMKRVFSHYKGKRWKIGDVSALGTGKIACQANYDRVLDSMLSILAQVPSCMMTFDFSTTPWTVGFAKKDTAVSAEGRLARNVSSAIVSYDDTELCTRVWYQTYDKNKNATWKSKDASTRNKWGVVEGTVRTSSDMTGEEITATVNAYLADHKDPRISVSIQGEELNQITRESMDKFVPGKLFRLALPDYDVTVEEHITSVSWQDIYGDPMGVTVSLGAEEDTVVTFLHNLDAKGSGGGGGGRAKAKQEEQWKEFWTDWDKQDEYISGIAVKQDKQGNILEQAGLTLNSKGLLVYAKTSNGLAHQFDILNDRFNSTIKKTSDKLQSEIDQQADQISLKVSKGNVIASINVSPEAITIKASRINLVGYVTADQLETTNATINNLIGGYSAFASLRAAAINMGGWAFHLSTIDGNRVVTWG